MIRFPLVVASLLSCCGPAARCQDAPAMVVTTDTRAYCVSLSQQIRQYGTLPREVRELQVEGHGLCEAGKVRGGINRLRRALMVLRAGARPPAVENVASPSKPSQP